MKRPTRANGAPARSAAAVVALLTALLVGASPAVASSSTPPEDPAGPTGQVRVVAASAESLPQRAAALVAAMTPQQKAGTVVMGHLPTTDPTALRDYMASTGVGGFILMGANVPGDEASLRAVTSTLVLDPALPPLISIDQEGGDVSRLPWDDFPASVTLKGEAPDAAALAFSGRGSLVERAGIGVNFGVIADFTADRGSFIYRRSLGTAPADASAHVGAAVSGEDPFAASTLKHFPGHGATPGDSHVGVPSTGMSYEQWRAAEALPFAAGIAAGAPLVMFGHLAYTSVDAAPASMSAEWHRILRDELGFTGIAITDDMGMLEASGLPQYVDPVANAVAAIAAGNDVVLGVSYSSAQRASAVVAGIAAAVASGAIPAARIDEAATRVVTLRLQLAAGGPAALPCPECAPAG